MAWISLVIVSLFLYTPIIGRAPQIAEQDFILRIPLPLLSIGIPIPSTGPLRLFVVSVVAWALLWGALVLLDRLLRVDLIKFLGLRSGMYFTSVPGTSNNLAVNLARITLWIMVAKVLFTILLAYLINAVVPGIVTTLAPEFAPVLVPILKRLLRSLVSIDYNTVMVVFSILVLIANRAFNWERRKRMERDLLLNSQQRKKMQAGQPDGISIPYSPNVI